jgi:hypothetical protein
MPRVLSQVALAISLSLLSGCGFMQMEADKFGDKRDFADVGPRGFRPCNQPYGNNGAAARLLGGGYAGPITFDPASLKGLFPTGNFVYVPAPIPSPHVGK